MEDGEDAKTQSGNSDAPDSCAAGFWYADNRVMTGTLLDENNTDPNTQQWVEVDGVRQNIVRVKYSKKKVRVKANRSTLIQKCLDLAFISYS